MARTLKQEKRRNKRINKKKRIRRLNAFANKLNQNLPRSECWFKSLYTRHYSISSDKYNQPVNKYIPDVVNLEFKYIIEIDGSVHNLDCVKLKDLTKEQVYTKLGFKVFRIRAYNELDYIKVIDELVKIRGNISKPTLEYTQFLTSINR